MVSPRADTRCIIGAMRPLRNGISFRLRAIPRGSKNLIEEHDYEFKVVRTRTARANPALASRARALFPERWSITWGPEDKTYAFSGHSLCSPTIVKLPKSGDLMTAMDVFTGQFGNSKLTLLFKSKDGGKTWRYVTDIYPSFWPKLFVHKGKLHICSPERRITAIWCNRQVGRRGRNVDEPHAHHFRLRPE